ncbi:IPExxxVDY family protein [Chishuiella sp.]|uniref:IPExxxVDY family protein n=1 Tax=Chishuiella sp. TaxID=1969467 RepID=UPI0028A65C3E|nr:IPExxxVDY family protein [Chishuiella sp.]
MAELLLYDDWIDFHLIGVNSSINTSIQFIFHLNSTFGTYFQRVKDLDIFIDDHTYYFEIYEWFDEVNKIDYQIIKNIPNKSDSKKNEVNLSNLFKESILLVPNYKNCNYIVKISGWEGQIADLQLPFFENDFIKTIKKIEINLISTAERLVF